MVSSGLSVVFTEGVTFQKFVEGWEVVGGGGDGGMVDAIAFKNGADALAVAAGELVVGHAHVAVAGVDDALVAVLVVAKDDFADVGDAFFGGVEEAEGHGFVFCREGAERFADFGVEEIGDEEDEGFAFEGVEKEVAGGGDVGAGFLGDVGEDFADAAEDLLAAFGGGEEENWFGAKEEEADFVAVVAGTEGEDGGDFCGEFAFAEFAAAVEGGSGDVDGDDDGEFAFLTKFTDEGLSGSGGDVPVDEADFVAVLVFAELVEIESLSFEGGVILAAEGFVDESLGADLEAPNALHDFLDGFLGEHGCRLSVIRYQLRG